MTTPTTPLDLVNAPTPVRPLDGIAGLWVKDEGTAGDLYGGNKVRKLAWLLADAKAKGVHDIVTIGAIGSHHVLATALYAAAQGIRTHALLFAQPETGAVRANAGRIDAACASFTVLSHVGLSEPRAVAAQVARIRWAQGHLPLWIPTGGSSGLGTLGWLHGGLELCAQVASGQLPAPARVYVALGSGATAAGLWAGLALGGLKAEVVAVRVVPRLMGNRARLRWLAARAFARHGRSARLGPLAIVHDRYGEGYGVVESSVEQAVARGRSLGLPLETTYTGKAFAHCLADLAVRPATAVFLQTATAVAPPPPPGPLPAELEALLMKAS